MVVQGSGEKPNVLFLMAGGRRYKCWARSEEEMSVLVAKVEALQLQLVQARDTERCTEDSEARRAAARASPQKEKRPPTFSDV